MEARAVRPAAAWDYKIVKVGPSSALQSETLLNKLGGEGWDLVLFVPTAERAFAGEGTYYLKRQRPERP